MHFSLHSLSVLGMAAYPAIEQEAGDGFTHIVPPSSVKAVKAQFVSDGRTQLYRLESHRFRPRQHSINVAIESALAKYS